MCHDVCRQAAEEASSQLRAAQQAEQGAAERLSLQKSALSAMEADFDARTARLQAALQEAATARSSVDALQAEVGKASSKAQTAQKVSITQPAHWMESCSALSTLHIFCHRSLPAGAHTCSSKEPHRVDHRNP